MEKERREVVDRLSKDEDFKNGIVNMASFTQAERRAYEEGRKARAKRNAYTNGLNMYNYYAPNGRVQRSSPPAREQRVYNEELKREITIKHFD